MARRQNYATVVKFDTVVPHRLRCWPQYRSTHVGLLNPGLMHYTSSAVNGQSAWGRHLHRRVWDQLGRPDVRLCIMDRIHGPRLEYYDSRPFICLRRVLQLSRSLGFYNRSNGHHILWCLLPTSIQLQLLMPAFPQSLA
jgi:hypothetical protein